MCISINQLRDLQQQIIEAVNLCRLLKGLPILCEDYSFGFLNQMTKSHDMPTKREINEYYDIHCEEFEIFYNQQQRMQIIPSQNSSNSGNMLSAALSNNSRFIKDNLAKEIQDLFHHILSANPQHFYNPDFTNIVVNIQKIPNIKLTIVISKHRVVIESIKNIDQSFVVQGRVLPPNQLFAVRALDQYINRETLIGINRIFTNPNDPKCQFTAKIPQKLFPELSEYSSLEFYSKSNIRGFSNNQEPLQIDENCRLLLRIPFRYLDSQSSQQLEELKAYGFNQQPSDERYNQFMNPKEKSVQFDVDFSQQENQSNHPKMNEKILGTKSILVNRFQSQIHQENSNTLMSNSLPNNFNHHRNSLTFVQNSIPPNPISQSSANLVHNQNISHHSNSNNGCSNGLSNNNNSNNNSSGNNFNHSTHNNTTNPFISQTSSQRLFHQEPNLNNMNIQNLFQQPRQNVFNNISINNEGKNNPFQNQSTQNEIFKENSNPNLVNVFAPPPLKNNVFQSISLNRSGIGQIFHPEANPNNNNNSSSNTNNSNNNSNTNNIFNSPIFKINKSSHDNKFQPNQSQIQCFPQSHIQNIIQSTLNTNQSNFNNQIQANNIQMMQDTPTFQENSSSNYLNISSNNSNGIIPIYNIPVNTNSLLANYRMANQSIHNISQLRMTNLNQERRKMLELRTNPSPMQMQIPKGLFKFKKVKNLFNYFAHTQDEQFIPELLCGVTSNLTQEQLEKVRAFEDLNLLETQPKANESFQKLYNCNQFNDVVVRHRGFQTHSHKMVLISSSPYLRELLDEHYNYNEVMSISLRDDFDPQALHFAIQYMYMSKLQDYEIEQIDLDLGFKLLYLCNQLRIHGLLHLIIIRVIIRKMTFEKVLSMLRFAAECSEGVVLNEEFRLMEPVDASIPEQQKNDYKIMSEFQRSYRVLFRFLIEYFAAFSKEILSLNPNGVSAEITNLTNQNVFKIVNAAVSKARDIDHLSELISLLIFRGFGNNLIDVLIQITKNIAPFMTFDRQFLPYLEESTQRLDSHYCYETTLDYQQLLQDDEDRNNQNQNQNPNSAYKNPNGSGQVNHTELSNIKQICQKTNEVMKSKSKEDLEALILQEDITLRGCFQDNATSGGSSPVDTLFKDLQPDYRLSFMLQSREACSPKAFISQIFYSQRRQWCLFIEIDQDLHISAYIQERGQILKAKKSNSQQDVSGQQEGSSIFGATNKNNNKKSEQDSKMQLNFTSCLFKLSLCEQKENISKQTFLFYSFPNDHNAIVGNQNILSLQEIGESSKLTFQLWVIEYPCHSAVLHYISVKFQDMLQSSINSQLTQVSGQNNGAKNDHKSGNNASKNTLNTSSIDNQKDITYRKSYQLLESCLIKECQKVTVEMYENENPQAQNQDPSAPQKIQVDRLESSFQNQENEKEQALIQSMRLKGLNQKEKQLTFYDISVFDLFYLLSSDYLNVDHEQFVVYLLYRYCINKNDEQISLILHGVRFSFLELSHLLNLARDHIGIQNNKYFSKRLEIEINKRLNSDREQPQNCSFFSNQIDKSRRFYNIELYQKWNFTKDFLNWLIESDHHEGFLNEINTVKNALSQNLSDQKQLVEEFSNFSQNYNYSQIDPRRRVGEESIANFQQKTFDNFSNQNVPQKRQIANSVVPNNNRSFDQQNHPIYTGNHQPYNGNSYIHQQNPHEIQYPDDDVQDYMQSCQEKCSIF